MPPYYNSYFYGGVTDHHQQNALAIVPGLFICVELCCLGALPIDNLLLLSMKFEKICIAEVGFLLSCWSTARFPVG